MCLGVHFPGTRHTALCRPAAQRHALRLQVTAEGEITGVQPSSCPV